MNWNNAFDFLKESQEIIGNEAKGFIICSGNGKGRVCGFGENTNSDNPIDDADFLMRIFLELLMSDSNKNIKIAICAAAIEAMKEDESLEHFAYLYHSYFTERFTIERNGGAQ